MNRKLFEAAVQGSVSSLVVLLQEDPLILDRVIVNCFNETPLHVAAMLGHKDFVNEILCRKPELAREVNSRRSSPLHLASAKGYVEIVQALLFVNSEMCLARDRDGRNPLHLAAIKGHVDVLKELVRARPHAARVTVAYSGVTILHLCVNHNQLEALKLLVETLGTDEFVNSKDDDGNTILHLAVADKQIQLGYAKEFESIAIKPNRLKMVETINFLLTSSTMEVNATNANGFTAADVLAQSRRDVKDKNITESLKRAGASGAEANRSSVSEFGTKTNTSLSWDTDYRISSPHSLEKVLEYWLEKTRNTLMVVASLIATMAFQVGVNPPGGVWQDDCQGKGNTDPHLLQVGANPPGGVWQDDCQGKGNTDLHQAGYSILASKDQTSYDQFLICNTIGFVASLSIILLLISGLPYRRKFIIWILMVIMWVAVTAMALTYLFSIYMIGSSSRTTVDICNIIIFTWIGLMAFLLGAHAIRLLLKIIRKSKKSASKKRDGDEGRVRGRGRGRGRGLTLLNHDAVVVV